MKPPLTVEARVAEELRTWLASELEHLDASNTNQFAHHVVTILLHEDLDIEDEPLYTGDDFLRDIYNIKQGKNRENQKKAAVQFLRGAVCCDDPMEAEIKEVVDELMVKIEETKLKMNKKKALKRSLLMPIAINVEEIGKTSCIKSDSSEERYNEAFPSLSGEESPCKDGPVCINGNASVWSGVPHGKENVKAKVKWSTKEEIWEYPHPESMQEQTSVFFCNKDEAQACSLAIKVASMVITESSPASPHETEVPPAVTTSSTSVFESPHCWRSAFTPTCLTKMFHPVASSLHEKKGVGIKAKVFKPVVINKQDIVNDYLKIRKGFLDSFFPIIDSQTQLQLDRSHSAMSDNDQEVEVILEYARQLKEEKKKQAAKEKKLILDDTPGSSTGVLTFPDHFGTFWDKLNDRGVIALYPVFDHRDVSPAEDTDKVSLDDTDSDYEDTPSWSRSSDTEYNIDSVIPFVKEEEELIPHEGSSATDDKPTAFDRVPSLSLSGQEDTGVFTSPYSHHLQSHSDADKLYQTSCELCTIGSVESECYLHGLYWSQSGTKAGIFSEAYPDSVRFEDEVWYSSMRPGDLKHPWDSLWSANAWDSIQQDLMGMRFPSKSHKVTHLDNLLMPSLLSSCLSSKVDQILQRAFVNSFFSSSDFESAYFKETEPAFQCSEVEQYLYSSHGGPRSKILMESKFLILGQTCSGWLENNCLLGSRCPFSHPSI